MSQSINQSLRERFLILKIVFFTLPATSRWPGHAGCLSCQLLDAICRLPVGHVFPKVYWRRGQSIQFSGLCALCAGEGQNCCDGLWHDVVLDVRLYTGTHILWLDLRSHVPGVGQDLHQQGQLLALRSRVNEVSLYSIYQYPVNNSFTLI